MPVFAFSAFITIISLGALVLIVMLIVRGVTAVTRVRQEAFYKALDKGVYDYRLLGKPRGASTAPLGWGIFFVAVGLGIFLGLAANIDPMILRMGMPGALIPLFIGVGLIIFYYLSRSKVREAQENNRPVTLPPEGGEDGPAHVHTVDSDGHEESGTET